MNCVRWLLAAALLPAGALAAERPLKIDPTRSYVEVDVTTTLKNFTAHLDTYAVRMTADDSGKIKTAVLEFRFADLKTGDDGRNADLLKWMGGPDATGRFELGILALAPDGQGQLTGKLTFHHETKLVEFSVNVDHTDATYTITGDPTIDYRDWKLKVFKRDFVLKVGPELHIRFKFVATPDDAAARG